MEETSFVQSSRGARWKLNRYVENGKIIFCAKSGLLYLPQTKERKVGKTSKVVKFYGPFAWYARVVLLSGKHFSLSTPMLLVVFRLIPFGKHTRRRRSVLELFVAKWVVISFLENLHCNFVIHFSMLLVCRGERATFMNWSFLFFCNAHETTEATTLINFVRELWKLYR